MEPEITPVEATPVETPAEPSTPAEAPVPVETPAPVEPTPSDTPESAPEGDPSTPSGEAPEGNAPDISSAFEGYSPEEVEGLTNLIAEIRDNPTSAAEMLENLAAALKGDDPVEPGNGPGEVAPEVEGVSKVPQTLEELNEWYASQREAEKQAEEAARIQREAVEALDTRIDEMGYSRGTEESPAIDRATLVMLAHDQFGGDLDKAHETVQQWKQSIIDEALNPHREAKAKFAPQVQNLGVGAEPGKKVAKTFDEANEGLKRKLFN